MTDSITAVEAVWSRVAHKIGVDPVFVSCVRSITSPTSSRIFARTSPLPLWSFGRSILLYAYACAGVRVRRAEGNIFAPVRRQLQHRLRA